MLEKALDVLIEGCDNGLAIGRSYRDAPEIDGLVIIEAKAEIGEIIPVKISGAMAYDLAGMPVRVSRATKYQEIGKSTGLASMIKCDNKSRFQKTTPELNKVNECPLCEGRSFFMLLLQKLLRARLGRENQAGSQQDFLTSLQSRQFFLGLILSFLINARRMAGRTSQVWMALTTIRMTTNSVWSGSPGTIDCWWREIRCNGR